MQTLHRRAVQRPEPNDYDKKIGWATMREMVQGGEMGTSPATGSWLLAAGDLTFLTGLLPKPTRQFQ
jgi:hypothetical protein